MGTGTCRRISYFITHLGLRGKSILLQLHDASDRSFSFPYSFQGRSASPCLRRSPLLSQFHRGNRHQALSALSEIFVRLLSFPSCELFLCAVMKPAREN